MGSVDLTERDAQIIALTKKGISARRIRLRLGLDITDRSVMRVQAKYLGKANPAGLRNSFDNQFSIMMRAYIEECFRRLHKDPFLCENCGERQVVKCEWHHTRYEGATLYDLMLVCRSCNLARANVGLR